MSENRIAALVDELGQLIEEQAIAIEGGRPEAVALVTGCIERALAELQALDAEEVGARLQQCPGLRTRAERAAESTRRGRALLQAAFHRLAARCARLTNAGVLWYGSRGAVTAPLHGDSAGLNLTV